MTDTMLERMVAAMHVELVRQCEASPGVGDRLTILADGAGIFEGAYDYRLVARAALEAIREPSEEVLVAGARRQDDLRTAARRDGDNLHNGHMFAAMIDVILNEKQD